MRKIDQIKKDECLPCCIAMVLDRPRRSVPYFDPHVGGAEFADFWNAWFDAEGIEIRSFEYGPRSRFAYEYDKARAWIAIVPGRPPMSHAVVMRGKKLFHDPYRWGPRVRRPTKINFGLLLNA